MYNTETINVQFLNQSFLDKLDQGLTKEASVAMSAFVRQKLREDGFTRKIMDPVLVSQTDLDRQTTEEPTIIAEKEPDSVAATIPLHSRGQLRYWKGARYAVNFNKITSNEFKKSKFEMATYRTDIRTILQENSVKDLQKQEDTNFIAGVDTIITAQNAITAGLGSKTTTGLVTISNVMEGVKEMAKKQLPVGCILMTQSTYADVIKQPSTQIGSPAASELFRGQAQLDNFFGYKIITTIKNDVIADGVAYYFAPTQYLGQMYLLQDAMVFLKTEADLVTFWTYESVGIGLGNVNAVYKVIFGA